MRRINDAAASLVATLRGKYEWYAQKVDGLSDDLPRALAAPAVAAAHRLERAEGRLAQALASWLSETDHRVTTAATRLNLLSPYSVLERGYSLTTDASGRVVKCAADAPVGAKVTTRLASGVLESVVSSSISQDAPPGGADKNAKEGRDG